MKKQCKKLLFTLLMVIAVLGLFPALKANADAATQVYVGGVKMTSGTYLANGATSTTTTKPATGGYAYFSDGTLILHDYSYTGPGHMQNSTDASLIYAYGDLNIRLKGSNTLTSAANQYAEVYYGINVVNDGTLTISGDELVVNCGRDSIYAYNVAITDAQITLSCDSDQALLFCEKLTVTNSKLNIDSGGYGIFSVYNNAALKVTDSTVTVSADKNGILLSNNCSITGKNSAVIVQSEMNGLFTYGKMTITGSQKFRLAVDAGQHGIQANSGLSVSSTDLEIISGESDSADYCGIFASSLGGNVSIYNSTLTITGDQYAILSKSELILSNCTGALNTNGYSGIAASKQVQISNDSDLRIYGTGSSVGIESKDKVYITSANVLVNGFSAGIHGFGTTGGIGVVIANNSDVTLITDDNALISERDTTITFSKLTINTGRMGIYHNSEAHTLTIGNSTIHISSGEEGILCLGATTINKSDVTINTSATGMYSNTGNITVANSFLTITANQSGISTGGAVTLTSSKVRITAYYNGIYADSATLNYGDVQIRSTTTANDTSYCAINADPAKLTITKNTDQYIKASTTSSSPSTGTWVKANLRNFDCIAITPRITTYVDASNIAAPEIGALPDFTAEPWGAHYTIESVVWKPMTNGTAGAAMTGLDTFQYRTTYRVYVTCVAEPGWSFADADRSAWINDKAVASYTTTSGDLTRVEMWAEYTPVTTPAGSTVTIGSVTLQDGQYLSPTGTAATTTRPSGGYAYYKSGVLHLNNYQNNKATVQFTEGCLEINITGTNIISSLCDSYESDNSTQDRPYRAIIAGTGSLKFAGGYTMSGRYCSVEINGEFVINSGTVEITDDVVYGIDAPYVTVNGGTLTTITAQGGVLYNPTEIRVTGTGRWEFYDAGCWWEHINRDSTVVTGYVYVGGAHKPKLENCDVWDGTTPLYAYDTVWITGTKITLNTPVYVGGFALKDGEYLSVDRNAVISVKPTGGYAYYKDGVLTLNNFTYDGKGYRLNASYTALIYSENDLTIQLQGTNTLTSDYTSAHGIYAPGCKVAISGSGMAIHTYNYIIYADEISFADTGVILSNKKFNGIYAGTALKATNATIDVRTGGAAAIAFKYEYADATFDGCTVTLNGATYGIRFAYDGYVNATDCTMNITAQKHGISAVTDLFLTFIDASVTIDAVERGISADGVSDIWGTDSTMDIKATQDGIVVYDALTINGNNFTVDVKAGYDGISGQSIELNCVDIEISSSNTDDDDSYCAIKTDPAKLKIVKKDSQVIRADRNAAGSNPVDFVQTSLPGYDWFRIMEDTGPVIVAKGWSGDTQWTLTSDGVMTFTGTGNIKSYGYNKNQPWLAYADKITSVVINDGIKAVGSGAFMGLTKLESVTLPTTGLTKIGEAAFYGCTSLKEITIPEGIYTIWLYTFKGCTSLEKVKMPKTLIKVDQGAFENCTSLTYVYFPTNVEIIGSWSFKGCTGLEEVDMTWTNATKIREGAFKNCSALTTIHLPERIQTLGDSCFYGIGATSFTVPETVTSIEAWCFARANVTKITFKGNAPSIGEGAFNKITLTAWYNSAKSGWTSSIKQNYGGTVTWKAQ